MELINIAKYSDRQWGYKDKSSFLPSEGIPSYDEGKVLQLL